jgi:hypothetical protein
MIVHQKISNYGERIDNTLVLTECIHSFNNVKLLEFNPRVYSGGTINETKKRSDGLEYAKKLGCTHFIHIDVDEYYEDFGRAKDLFIQSDRAGSVCKMYTYFKQPTLRLNMIENYFVPFIHRLDRDTKHSREYPFYVDPTRRINVQDVIELPIFMHHFSWVRKDIEMKCRNSSARKNIERNTHLQEWRTAEAGKYLKCYDTTLLQVPNIFNITV